MNIKELESRLAIDRATIRYYEKEGLLHPARRANGYRDYSEEDAETLEKIALLRRLGMSIEDIRRVQDGELPLSLALERQDERLLARQVETYQALQISQAIRSDGASYQTLQPDKYKHQLPPPIERQQPALPNGPKHYAIGHPWRRFLARKLDMTLYSIPWELAALLIFRVSADRPLSRFLAWLMGMALFLALEPLLLSAWGTTPGKWLMGLRLECCYSTGPEKPNYNDAFLRCLSLSWYGFGLGIPVVETICMFLSYRRAGRGEEQPWDEMWEYTATPFGSFRKQAAYGAALAALVLCMIPAALYSQRPVNKGQLTLEEYVENVNDIMAFQQNFPCYQMQTDGTWVHHRDSAFCTWSFDSAYYFAPVDILTDNGYVTGFAVDMEWCASNLRKAQTQILLRGLVFADRKISWREMTDLQDDVFTLSYKEGDQASMTLDGWLFRWEDNRLFVEKS